MPSDYCSMSHVCPCHAVSWLKCAPAQLHGLLSTQHRRPPWPRPCLGHEVSLIPEWLGSEELLLVISGAENSSPIRGLEWKAWPPLSSWFLWGVSSSRLLPHHRALVMPSASPCTAPLEGDIDPYPLRVSGVSESIARVMGA